MLNAPKNTSRFQASLETTRALRDGCAPIFLPLFDHCIRLALDSHMRGYFKRAGIELRHARKVAAYTVCECGQPAIRDTSACAAHTV